MIRISRRLPLFLLCAILLVPLAGGASAQDEGDAGAASGDNFVVATREAPPFAMKGDNGEWSGVSIWLWQRIAEALGIDYRFEEASLSDMIDGVADGRFDASVAAMTITPQREEAVDFTHPFYTTGFGIAVSKHRSTWTTTLVSLFSWGFVQAVAALALLLAVVGLLFWLVERRNNPEQFGGSAVRGVGSGLWFSAVTMTTVGYGDKAPQTLAGRILALIWMFAAILIISTFTGMIASSLTTDRLSGAVTGPEDLPNVTVGSISGSASDDWLSADRVGFRSFDDVAAGLDAVRAGRIDAFVYDKPLLQYRVKTDHAGVLEVLPATFGRQDYGIALPPGSDLRERFNHVLLQTIESGDWDDLLFQTVGKTE